MFPYCIFTFICGGGGADLIFHTLTISAVPMFMGVSGYLLFFREHKDNKFWIKMIKRYGILFLLWFVLYVLFTYLKIPENQENSVMIYILNNRDGWMYWYLIVLLEILIAYPIIKVFISNEMAKRYYIVLWIIFVSLRQASTVFPIPGQIFDIIQVPLFQTKTYIGGTVLAHYPTECLGVFVVLGAFIDKIINLKIKKIVVIGTNILGIMAGIYIVVGEKYLYNRGLAIDIVTQPIQIQVCIFSAMIILYIRMLYNVLGDIVKKTMEWVSKQSLGVYMIHPFVIGYSIKLCSGLQVKPVVGTVCSGTITIVVSLLITYLLRRVIPRSVSYYII